MAATFTLSLNCESLTTLLRAVFQTGMGVCWIMVPNWDPPTLCAPPPGGQAKVWYGSSSFERLRQPLHSDI